MVTLYKQDVCVIDLMIQNNQCTNTVLEVKKYFYFKCL